MAGVFDYYLTYQFIKRLSTPFEETKAFELGILDKKGKLLKSPKTREEKDAYTAYDRLIFNLKRMLAKIGFKSKIGTFAAALLLLKEGNDIEEYQIDDEDYLEKRLLEEIKILQKETDKTYRDFLNENN